MCVAVVGQVVSIDRNIAKLDFDGALMNVNVDFLTNINIGDYLVVHAGYAIEKIKPEDAIKTINVLKEIQEIEKS